MPTLAEMQVESYWRAEYMPPAIITLAEGVRAHLGLGAEYIGSKGNADHTYGYHRSRAWILGSRFSDYGGGDYSVQSVEDQAGDANWLCALDINPGSVDALIAMCKRLDAAVRAGRLPQLREWYGNVDGDQIVDGFDLLFQRAATSDSSHLWHLHLSFLRGLANADHAVLLAVLTGTDVASESEGDPDMKYLVSAPGGEKIFLSDGLTRRHVKTGEEYNGWIAQGAIRYENVDLSWYGPDIEDVTPAVQVDAAKVAAALIANADKLAAAFLSRINLVQR